MNFLSYLFRDFIDWFCFIFCVGIFGTILIITFNQHNCILDIECTIIWQCCLIPVGIWVLAAIIQYFLWKKK